MCRSRCSFCILVLISSALPPDFGFCCINEKSTCSQPTSPVVLPTVSRDSRNVALPGAWLELGRDTTSPGDRGWAGAEQTPELAGKSTLKIRLLEIKVGSIITRTEAWFVPAPSLGLTICRRLTSRSSQAGGHFRQEGGAAGMSPL
ncbi:unnamed protein product [Rangifer tarandus platyrhynchus]|uniref:Uncharacterized protein n=1 Tax=Rangifer tarandus platyrhynchus TaxID=3082113 RepID=A0AC59YJC8_RANTA